MEHRLNDWGFSFIYLFCSLIQYKLCTYENEDGAVKIQESVVSVSGNWINFSNGKLESFRKMVNIYLSLHLDGCKKKLPFNDPWVSSVNSGWSLAAAV